MGAFSSLVMFSVIANLFLWYFLANEKIGWREGVVLLFMYFLFLTISLGGFKPYVGKSFNFDETVDHKD